MKLGIEVKDKITEFTGIVTSRTQYLYGCVRVGVSGTDKDGKPMTEVFDEPQLEIVEGGRVIEQENQDTGGPRPVPPPRV